MPMPQPIIQIDTRENLPLNFSELGYASEVVGLPFGDYGVKGYSGAAAGDLIQFAVERKSLSDLCGSLGNDRDRFEREIMRMAAYRFKALVIEASEEDIRAGNYRSKIHPNAVIGALRSWEVNYDLHVKFCGGPQGAAKQIAIWVKYFWQHREKEVKRHAESATRPANENAA